MWRFAKTPSQSENDEMYPKSRDLGTSQTKSAEYWDEMPCTEDDLQLRARDPKSTLPAHFNKTDSSALTYSLMGKLSLDDKDGVTASDSKPAETYTSLFKHDKKSKYKSEFHEHNQAILKILNKGLYSDLIALLQTPEESSTHTSLNFIQVVQRLYQNKIKDTDLWSQAFHIKAQQITKNLNGKTALTMGMILGLCTQALGKEKAQKSFLKMLQKTDKKQKQSPFEILMQKINEVHESYGVELELSLISPSKKKKRLGFI